METVEVRFQEHTKEEVPEGIRPDPGQASSAPAVQEEAGQEKGTGPEPPEEERLPAAVEAILFAMGEAVPVSVLASALGVSEDRILTAAELLAERFEARDSGVCLNRYEDCLQLSTKPELYEYLIRVASEPKKPRLTPTLLETLSIIAFRQPVTRLEVEKIRGVNSDFAINRLVSYDLVCEVGRKEVPGRPLLFGTTQQFLRSFGISSLEELPEPGETQMEMFREEAEDEVRTSLQI
ncbi:MAG: SMC-Scp complex subunit ScpB [Eubacteriales bacterium]|nr:SMC-Scp complex subunit ScpB [Eubacteriales bacterium]